MKQLKMLGLAAIAALGLMAFVGAGTASAITLSTNAAGTIHYEIGTQFHWTLKPGTSAVLESGGSVITTCTESTMLDSLDSPVVETGGKRFASGTRVGGRKLVTTWGGCSQTTHTISGGSFSITKGTGDTGSVSSSGTEVTSEIFGVSCVYGTGEGTSLGTVTGGEAPVLTIATTIAKISGGFLCPSSSTFTATYILTSPHALHFVS